MFLALGLSPLTEFRLNRTAMLVCVNIRSVLGTHLHRANRLTGQGRRHSCVQTILLCYLNTLIYFFGNFTVRSCRKAPVAYVY
uniref:Uncharacterized protein n=1 Tax=Anguilla anguilla TaxID=7936 RepID=A0A0E9WP20_ANGAN